MSEPLELLRGAGAGVRAPEVAAARWWVLRTKARQEKTVAGHLVASKVEHFLPLQTRKQPWARGGRVFSVPLFPGYVFVRSATTLTDRELGVGRVVQIVRVEDQARIEHELAQIKAAIAAGAVLVPAQYLERGTEVVVTSGPLKDVEGVVERLEGADRLYLQVQTLGRALTIEISPMLIGPRR